MLMLSCSQSRQESTETRYLPFTELILGPYFDVSDVLPNLASELQLQQALRMSLAEQQPQCDESASPTRSVHPQAVAFSPVAYRSLSTPAPRDASSSFPGQVPLPAAGSIETSWAADIYYLSHWDLQL